MHSIYFLLLLLLAALPGEPASAQSNGRESAEPETVIISGVATPRDHYTYRLEPFSVPAHTGRIEVDFEYTGRGDFAEIEIGLFDPHGFRGTSRFSKGSFEVGRYEATPSYFPGFMPAGEWQVSLGFPTVRQESEYRITLRLYPETSSGFIAPRAQPLKSGPGWYQGDFHTHTGHSDAFGCHDTRGEHSPCQVYQVAESAHRAGLDFVAVTDHNTVSHYHDLRGLQPSFPDLLLIRGQEITTFYGHANLYGVGLPVDFRIGYEGRNVGHIQEESEELGGLFSINHPGRETGARCTGCGWSADSTDYARLEALEIVNSTHVETDISGIPFWHNLLNQGYRITGIGGSDDHAAGFGNSHPGTPTTVVWAAELSEAAILDGVRSGRVYLKTDSAETPDLSYYADAGYETWQMGSTIYLAELPVEGPVKFHAVTLQQEGLTAEWIQNGEVVAVQQAGEPNEEGKITFSYIPGTREEGWVRLNLRRNGTITVISNPIYLR